MNSYNPINGVHATENAWLNNEVLKGEFAFRGLLMSDWGSCYNTEGIANAGLDLEMPYAQWYTAEKLGPLLDSGKVSMATIDDKIRRQLRLAIGMGWLDRPQQDTSIPLDDPASIAVNVDEARAGITLLKNDDNLLPLDPVKVEHIVVLGPNADHPVTSGGGIASSTISTLSVCQKCSPPHSLKPGTSCTSSGNPPWPTPPAASPIWRPSAPPTRLSSA